MTSNSNEQKETDTEWRERERSERNSLPEHAKKLGLESIFDEKFATKMDDADKLAKFRDHFHIPAANPHAQDFENVKESIYLCGNSLGAMPKKTREIVNEELHKWQVMGVEGHFLGKRPWATIDERVTGMSADIVGAKQSEVTIMNTLSVNLHLFMTSFFRPQGKRTKILIEKDAFCSDHHVVRSQLALHGLDPSDHLIQVEAHKGGHCHTEDVLKAIEEHGDDIALVMLGAVQFYTGQWFEMETITKAAQAKGCYVGWDCAHAAGNVPLQLNAWGVDFACWCTYKYLNSGPGAIAGAFMHEKHHNKSLKELPRLCGWWGQEATQRFKMESEWAMKPGAQSYQLSNPAVLPVLCLEASLLEFHDAGLHNLRKKSVLLTGYLEELLDNSVAAGEIKHDDMHVLTPRDPSQRGCQLSVYVKTTEGVKHLHDKLAAQGIICDVRQPDVIRISPAPMYNSFTDIYRFVNLLKAELKRDATS